MPDIHGVVGCTLFSILLLHCVRQVVLLKSAPFDSEQSHLFLQLKLYFHAVFALSCLLEVLFSASLLLPDGKDAKWGYSLHMVGLYCGIISFLLVIRLWNHVLFSQRLLRVRSLPYVIFLLINFVSLLVDLVVFNMYGESESSATVLAIIANIIYVLSLFVVSCVLLWFGYDLKKKLTAAPAGISDVLQALLRKINISLLLISLCYGVRIFGVGYVTAVTVRDGQSPKLGQRAYLLWILGSFWIPFLGTGLLFLHIMHYRPRTTPTAASSAITSSSAVSAVSSSAPLPPVESPTFFTSRVMSLSIDNELMDPLAVSLFANYDAQNDHTHIQMSSPELESRAHNRMEFFSSDSLGNLSLVTDDQNG